ncbi:MAG TPA: FGGY-family carbohydrate kinase [bacterium]
MFLGVDIGTSSSKAVLVSASGKVVASATRSHGVSTPRPEWFEHDADATWWGEARALIRELGGTAGVSVITAVGVSAIGPALLVSDDAGRPLRPAILYGIDTRAAAEIEELTARFGEATLMDVAGNRLTSQAVGPKLAWIRRHEPETWGKTRRWFLASGYLVFRLTGEYVADHYSASASSPLYDLRARTWWDEAWHEIAPAVRRPRLAWPGEVVGRVTPGAAADTGLPEGTPVIAGTIDALAEAYSAGCREVGDTMVMYGSTLFLIQTVTAPAPHPGLWAATGRTPATYSVAAGMATSGLITTWFADLVQTGVPALVEAAERIPPGSDGLVLLPYFAGERTPLFDPQARGCWMGLTLRHTRAHLYRSILEGVAYGARHNLETMAEAGGRPRRLFAVGGGTRGSLWTQIISDVTRLRQCVPTITVGASYGDAQMAADAAGVETGSWNPVAHVIEPDGSTGALYDRLYAIYLRAYPALRDDLHTLGAS